MSSGWREKVAEEAYRSFRERSPQFWSLALQFILLSKGKMLFLYPPGQQKLFIPPFAWWICVTTPLTAADKCL